MTIQNINIFSKTNLINLLVALIPISYMLGNLAINLNSVLLIITVFSFYRSNVFKIKYNLIDKVIFFFLRIFYLMEFLIIFLIIIFPKHQSKI